MQEIFEYTGIRTQDLWIKNSKSGKKQKVERYIFN